MTGNVLRKECAILVKDHGLVDNRNIIVGVFSQDREGDTSNFDNFKSWCTANGYNTNRMVFTDENYHINHPEYKDLHVKSAPLSVRLGLISAGDLMLQKQHELHNAIVKDSSLTPIIANPNTYILNGYSSKLLEEFHKNKYDTKNLCEQSSMAQIIKLSDSIKEINNKTVNKHYPIIDKIQHPKFLDAILDEIGVQNKEYLQETMPSRNPDSINNPQVFNALPEKMRELYSKDLDLRTLTIIADASRTEDLI